MDKAEGKLFVGVVLFVLVLCLSTHATGDAGPVAYWGLDEGEGSIAFDYAGINDGNIIDANWTTGQVDGALSFDGNGDYVNCGNDISLDITDEITISAWVKRTDFQTNGLIAGKNNGDSITAGYGLLSYTDGFEFAFYADGNWRRTTPRVTTSANQWHHVVATFNGSNAYLYIDGEQQASLGYVGTITPATGYSFHLGYWRPAIPQLVRWFT